MNSRNLRSSFSYLMFPNFVALTHANTLTLSTLFVPHRKCKSFSLKAIKCAHELHSFTQTKCEWIKMWKNSRLVSAQNKSSCTNAMTFVFQENSVINWPHVHFYTSFSCCSSILIWFSLFGIGVILTEKVTSQFFTMTNETDMVDRLLEMFTAMRAWFCYFIIYLGRQLDCMWREREVKTKDNFLRFLSFANAFNRMWFFSIVFAFPNSFLSIFFGNRCLFTQPLKLAIFHISSEFIPKIKRKKITAGSWEQNSKKERKKYTDRKKLNE